MKLITSELGLEFRAETPLTALHQTALTFPFTLDVVMAAIARKRHLDDIFVRRGIKPDFLKKNIELTARQFLEGYQVPTLASQMAIAWHLAKEVFPGELLKMTRKSETNAGTSFSIGAVTGRYSRELATPEWLGPSLKGLWNFIKPHVVAFHVANDLSAANLYINGVKADFRKFDQQSIHDIRERRLDLLLRFSREIKPDSPDHSQKRS